MDMLEQIIQLVTILFLLSMICERIADFLKHYLCSSNFFGIGDTITKFPKNNIKEQARAYRILKINLWCGIFTAAILKADLIAILNDINNAGKTIGWANLSKNDYQDFKWLLILVGIALTGCFISFGSKFWHDLLDLLLEVKNTKRAVTQSISQESRDLQTDFENLDPIERDHILKSAIQTFSGHWKESISNYIRIDAGKKIIDGKPTENICLRFYVESKEYKNKVESGVPAFIYYAGFKIPTDVVPDSGEMILHVDWENAGDGNVPVMPGKSISRMNNKATGTISLKVKKKIDGVETFYALSCYHVLCNNEYLNGISEVRRTQDASNPKEVKIPGDAVKHGGTSIGNIGWGEINENVDAAVALLNDASFLSDEIDQLGKPAGIYSVIADDENDLTVSFCGAKSGLVKDKLVKGCHANRPAKLPIGNIVFKDFIQIEKCSIPGDSGAPVIDKFNRLIGIIAGSDPQFTYVIPIHNIINQLKVNPIVNRQS